MVRTRRERRGKKTGILLLSMRSIAFLCALRASAVEFGFPAHSSLTVHRTMPRLCGERLPFPCLRLPPSVFSSNLTHRGGLYIKGYNPETFDPSVRLYFLTAFASLTMQLGLPAPVLRSHGGQISFPREGYAFSEANVSEFAELSPCPGGCE